MKKKMNIQQLDEALTKDPQNHQLLSERAYIHIFSDQHLDFEKAIDDLKRAIKQAPQNTYYLNLLIACYLKEKPKTAFYYAQKACKIDPKIDINIYLRGLCYEKLGKCARAIEDFTMVINSSPDYIPAMAHRSRCHGKMREFEKAVYDLFSEIQKTDKLSKAAPWNWSACLDDLLANKPQDPIILFMRAYDAALHWRWYKAEEYYDRAIEILPSEPAFYSHRSELRGKSGDLEKAINDISTAIKLAPENFRYYSKRADLLDRQGNYDEAINDLQKAIRFQPQDATLYQLRAIINMHKSENTGHDASLLKLSERDLKKAIKLDPEEPENYVKLGDIYYLLDLHNKAKRAYKKAMNTDSSQPPKNEEYLLEKLLEFYPNDEGYLDRLASWHEITDPERAVVEYSMLIKKQPTFVEYHASRAGAYMRLNQYEKALNDLDAAIELEPQKAMHWKQRALCNMKLGDFKGAIDTFKTLDKMGQFSMFLDQSYCYLMLGDEEKSLDSFQHSVQSYIIGYDENESDEKESDPLLPILPHTVFHFPNPDMYAMVSESVFDQHANFAAEIVLKCSLTYLAKIIIFLLKVNQNDLFNPHLLDVLKDIDFNKDPFINKVDEVKILQAAEDFANHYPRFGESFVSMRKRDGEKIFNIRIKSALLEYFEEYFKYSHSETQNKEKEKVLSCFTIIKKALIYKLQEELTELMETQENILIEARIQERNKIIADLSHSIKNMISTIIDPLESLKRDEKSNTQVIDNALRGANLIREIVNAMNLSFKGSVEDFIYDARNFESNTAVTLQDMLRQSLIYSITNMFDGKYFNIFMRQYFAEKDIFIMAKTEWESVSLLPDVQQLSPFLEKYFFHCEFQVDLAGQLAIGNNKGSAIKLLILMQEMVLNAVKYCSFVAMPQRSIQINLQEVADKITLRVQNRYKENLAVKTSGIGHILIDNFSKLLNAELKISKDNSQYTVEISFPNFWKESGK